MRYLIRAALLLSLMSVDAYAQDELGKVNSFVGNVDITVISTGKRFIPRVGTVITSDHKIRTGNNSFIELLLNDRTKIFIREVSVVSIAGLKLRESDPPTKVNVLTGKLRVTIRKTFKDRSFVLNTPTSVAGVRGTDFGVIASSDETRLVVFEGRVEVANVRKDIIKTFVVEEKEEVSVARNSPPTEPRAVPEDIMRTWFDYYDIDEDNRIIIKKKSDRGFLDNLLKKRDR